MESIKRIFVNHYTNTKFVRSEQQLEREKWIFCGCFPFHRYMLLCPIIAMQVCVGSLYAWSGYNIPIETAIYGPNLIHGVLVDRNIASVTFYIALGFLSISSAAVGPWLERNGPFKTATVGASLFFLGNMLTSLGVYVKSIALVYVGYGIIGGFGVGMCYLSAISAAQKWFPEIRGFTAGLAVTGFGLGAISAPFAQAGLIAKYGVSATFLITGVYYYFTQMISIYFLRYPPPGYSIGSTTLETLRGAEGQFITVKKSSVNQSSASSSAVAIINDTVAAKDTTLPPCRSDEDEDTVTYDVNSLLKITLLEALSTCEFGVMYIMFFGNELAGILLASKIQSLVTNQFGYSTSEAVLANALLGMCNSLGRLLLPLFSDLIKIRKPVFLLMMAVQICALASMANSIHTQDYRDFSAAVYTVIFFYGGGYGVIPAFLADQFSASNASGTHGVILLNIGVASVAGGLVFTEVLKQQTAYWLRVKPSTGLEYVYDVNFIWIVVVMACCFLFTAVLLSTDLKERRLPKRPNEVFRTRNLRTGRIVSYFSAPESCLGLRRVEHTSNEDDRDWEAYVRGLVTTSHKPVDVASVHTTAVVGPFSTATTTAKVMDSNSNPILKGADFGVELSEAVKGQTQTQ